MDFEEWWKKEDFFADNSGTEKDVARLAFNAAIDEAVNIIYTQGEYVDPNDLADEVKELKK